MRRNAGAYLREKILTQSSYMLVGGGFLLGLGIGSFAYYSGVWIGFPWSSVPFVVVALVALAAVRYLQRNSNR